MPRLYVVYDTNTYVRLSSARFRTLRALERSPSVIGIASHSVVLELLDQLSAPDAQKFRRARAALGRLVEHCRQYNGAQYILPRIASLDAQIRYLHFGISRCPPDEDQDALAGLAGEFAPEQVEVGRDSHRDTLAAVHEWAERVESTFVQALWDSIGHQVAPEAEDWGQFNSFAADRARNLSKLTQPEVEREVAEGIAKRVAISLALVPPPENRVLAQREIEQLADWIRVHLHDVVRLHIEVVARIIERGLDLRKKEHKNTTWDLRIASEVLAFTHLDPRRIWLVTNDLPLLATARQSDTGGVIHTLEEYEAALSDGTVEGL